MTRLSVCGLGVSCNEMIDTPMLLVVQCLSIYIVPLLSIYKLSIFIHERSYLQVKANLRRETRPLLSLVTISFFFTKCLIMLVQVNYFNIQLKN